MKIGDRVRIGAPYQYGFAGESSIEGIIQKIDDDVITITTARGTTHATLRFLLFIEVIPKEVEPSETRTEQKAPHP